MLVAPETDRTVGSAVCFTTVSVETLLETDIDVNDGTELRELLVKEGLVVGSDGLVDAWKWALIYERVPEVRFSCGQY